MTAEFSVGFVGVIFDDIHEMQTWIESKKSVKT